MLLWTSTLDLFWNDLALKPVYLPFVHQVVRHLGRLSRARHLGDGRQVIDLSQEGDPDASARVALAPGRRSACRSKASRAACSS